MSVGFSQIYLATGDVDGDGTLAVRAYFRPLVLLIWLGALVMGCDLGFWLSLCPDYVVICALHPRHVC